MTDFFEQFIRLIAAIAIVEISEIVDIDVGQGEFSNTQQGAGHRMPTWRRFLEMHPFPVHKAISAAGFRRIQRFVRAFDIFRDFAAGVSGRKYSNTNRHPLAVRQPSLNLRYRRPDFFGKSFRLILEKAGNQNTEFFAAITADNTSSFAEFLQYRSKTYKYFIADSVAKSIVDAFEMIRVNHQH